MPRDNGARIRKLDIIVDSPRFCNVDCPGFVDRSVEKALPVCQFDREPLRWLNTKRGSGWERTNRCKKTARKT